MLMPRRLAVEFLSVLLLSLLSRIPVSAYSPLVSSPGVLSSRVPTGPAAAESRGLTATVTGEVVDEQGSPVVDAEVEAAPGIQGAVPHRARTDAGGRFAIPGLYEGGPYVLRASHRGFAPESRSVTPSRTMTGYRLTLRPGATAFGTVVDEAGRPVAGARIELLNYEANFHPYRSISKPDGSFRISDLPAKVLELRVARRGFPLLKQTGIEFSRGARIDLGRLALPAGKPFQGKALDPQGRPLAGARVFAIYAGDSPFLLGASGDSGLEPETLTGPDGGFEIPRIGPGTYLSVCLPGYQPSLLFIPLPPSEPRRFVLAPAPPRPRISSRVLDEAGRPVAGARITLGDPEYLERDRTALAPCRKAGPLEWTTDAAGRFAFDLPESGEAELWVRAPGYLREIRKVAEGQTGGVDIVLRRGATVAGRVFAPDGSPVPGARVYATQDGGAAETVTDAQGRYRLVTVEPGWRELWADHPDLGEARRRLELAAGTRRLDLTLDGREEPAITGRVVGTDGEPLAGVRIQHPLSASTFETREDGAFRIVLGRGQILFTNETENLSFDREGYATLLYPFEPPALPLKGLEIRLEKGRDLTGRVLGVAPEKLADVLVEASRKDDSHRTGVEPDGTYRFKNLGSGTWSVKASLYERVAQRTVELGPEEASLDLELPPLTRVRGVVLAPDGSPVSGVTVRLADRAAGASAWPAIAFEEGDGSSPTWPSTQSGDDGTFSIEVQEGRYEVTTIAKGYDPASFEAPLVVGDRPIDGLEIRLKPGLVLRGRIPGMPEGSTASLAFTRDDHSVEADVEPDGTYRCAGLEPGEWQVEASLDVEEVRRGRRTRVTLAPGVPEAVFDVDLSLGDLTLAGRLTSGEEPLSATVVLLSPDGQPLSNGVIVESSDGGAFRFARLRAGRYLLRIEDYYRDRSIKVPVDLTSDREMTIDLLRPGG
jgi:protocatechuate 3,4-dioxygenase beta subunit